jgi:hypothetical protein
MLRTPVLLDEQINDFHRDGYVVVRGAFGAAEMRRIEVWTRELVELPEEPGKYWVYHEKSLLDEAHRNTGGASWRKSKVFTGRRLPKSSRAGWRI